MQNMVYIRKKNAYLLTIVFVLYLFFNLWALGVESLRGGAMESQLRAVDENSLTIDEFRQFSEGTRAKLLRRVKFGFRYVF